MLRRIDWAAADEEEEEEAMATDGAQRPNYCRLVWQVRGSVWGCNADIFRLLFDAITAMQCTHLKRAAGPFHFFRVLSWSPRSASLGSRP